MMGNINTDTDVLSGISKDLRQSSPISYIRDHKRHHEPADLASKDVRPLSITRFDKSADRTNRHLAAPLRPLYAFENLMQVLTERGEIVLRVLFHSDALLSYISPLLICLGHVPVPLFHGRFRLGSLRALSTDQIFGSPTRRRRLFQISIECRQTIDQSLVRPFASRRILGEFRMLLAIEALDFSAN